MRDCFSAVAQRNEIVGFDLVEVNPLLDVGTGVTSYLGAHLVIELLGVLCEQPWWQARES
jgi:agmatinase